MALVRAHWGLGLKALAGAFIADPTAEELEGFTRFQWASASAAVAAEMLEVYYHTDIRALLPAIRARTAVLHREADKGTRFELGREVAALIPGATLIPLPGSSHLFYHGDWPVVLDALLGFLCEPASTGPRLTGHELEVAGLVAEGLTTGHRPAAVGRAADRRGARGEYPAQAAGALAGPDRGVGDRAPASRLSGSVVHPTHLRGTAAPAGGTGNCR